MRRLMMAAPIIGFLGAPLYPAPPPLTTPFVALLTPDETLLLLPLEVALLRPVVTLLSMLLGLGLAKLAVMTLAAGDLPASDWRFLK